MHFCQQLLEVLHVSKERVDVPEIFHIVTKVLHRRTIERTDPNRLDVQVQEVIQLLLNSCQTTNTNMMQSVVDWLCYSNLNRVIVGLD